MQIDINQLINLINELKDAIKKANQCNDDICQGRAKWRMTLPANPKTDSDIIFGNVSSKAERLIKVLEEQFLNKFKKPGEKDLTPKIHVENGNTLLTIQYTSCPEIINYAHFDYKAAKALYEYLGEIL